MSAHENGELRLQQLCTQDKWWRLPHLRKLNLLILIPFFASYVGGFDGSMLNGIQTVQNWQECKAAPLGACYFQGQYTDLSSKQISTILLVLFWAFW